ncbi:hypothetical protein BD779DRAFT_1541983 [Infundibulicybe gibba]|nr:hypothetical protein BD779DRAFT_1541983 [Infundibulicybe gibba]
MSLASGSLLQQAQTTTYFNVASIVVLVHDWFLTIDSELAFIWNAKWNLGTFLYILTRYPAFIDTAVYLYGAIGHAIPVPVCGLVMAVSGWMFLFGFGISEVVMAICVWTMWGRTRRMAISLATLALAVTVVAVLGLHKHHSSATYIPLEDLHPNVPGCQTRPGGTRDALFIDFIALASLESVLFILMLSKAVQHSRVRSSTFVLECFRHGLIYYMMLSSKHIPGASVTMINAFSTS